jgi:hypothetical protein
MCRWEVNGMQQKVKLRKPTRRRSDDIDLRTPSGRSLPY